MTLHQDVPVLMRRYCLQHREDQLVVNMAKSLAIIIRDGNVASQLSQLAVRGITAQAREPLKNSALIKKKESEHQAGSKIFSDIEDFQL
uniref:AlNc14C68G4754 protein n=1 Tax=Albugo laibachii Nc14 TaxID=890382 RepID=F0WDN4_9STRA|nr:AlNc14C68G4754 [Albugo laibachii Nc14]|eukprot:CCA19310.1 AlNc14C68G4754 [Albugo laibachii Nc14]